MGLFKKKVKQESAPVQGTELPKLPELPELPDFPAAIEQVPASQDPFPTADSFPNQLPSFPKNPTGEQFSRDIIKNAISGEKEGDMNEGPALPEMNLTPKKVHEEEHYEKPAEIQKPKISLEQPRQEAMYVRIDKFEEGIRLFEKIKNKIDDIEKMFRDIKKIKDQEEKELDSWEQELRSIKEKIRRLNQEIFSKLE